MIVYKKYISDFIKCPFLFGKNIIASKQNTIKLNDMSLNIKKHIIELACYEMQNSHKYSLVEYRTQFTNKYYSRPSQAILAEKIVPKLNQVFDVFASNKFIGYNVPVDIALPGTSVIFRDILDFMMTDEDGNIVIAEIENLENFDEVKTKLKHWPHYFTPYSFIADQLGKKVTVKLIDPVNFCVIDASYLPDRFEGDLAQLRDIGRALSAPSLVRNLYACDDCEKKDNCL